MVYIKREGQEIFRLFNFSYLSAEILLANSAK